MSFVLLGILNSQAAGAQVSVVYRLQTLGGSTNDVANTVVVDSELNSYIAGQGFEVAANSTDILLAKSNPAGVIQWQRTLSGNSEELINSTVIDSADNLYALGYTNSTGEGDSDFLLAKYNSSGAIQWQRTLGSAVRNRGNGIAVDSSDNIYVVGFSQNSGTFQDCVIAKYNSSGAIQWQRRLAGNSDEQFSSIKIDSSDNIYVVGETRSAGAGDIDFLLAKYNSSGAIQWQRTLGTSENESGRSITIDSSGNIYVIGLSEVGFQNRDFLLAKYNSSGTLQWQRNLGGGDNEFGLAIAIDSLDNIYVNGYTESSGAGNRDFLLAKYNSSGTIQWQRTLGASANEEGNGIAVDSLDNLYITGYTDSTGEGQDDFFLGVLPNDGSLTGTYLLDGTSFIYQASSLTDSAASGTSSTSSLTASTPSLTSSTSSLADASASLTDHIVEL